MADDTYDSDEESELPSLPEAISNVEALNPSATRGVLTRRMSASVIVRITSRKVEEFDSNVLDDLDELLKKFPAPPSIVHVPQVTASNMSTSAMSAVRTGWGNLKIGLEKWGKKKDDKK